MFEERKRRQAAKKVRPGTGRALKPFRRWQTLTRSLYHLPPNAAHGRLGVYSVEVRSWQKFWSEDGRGKANLYLDRRHVAESPLPAAFPISDGTIEVRASDFGLKRCHFVGDDGAQQSLEPDPKSAEGRRAHLEQQHPALSRLIGTVSLIVLLIGLVPIILQLAQQLSQVPPVAENLGTFTSPVHLPVWANITLGLATVAASSERALRLRFSSLLD